MHLTRPPWTAWRALLPQPPWTTWRALLPQPPWTTWRALLPQPPWSTWRALLFQPHWTTKTATLNQNMVKYKIHPDKDCLKWMYMWWKEKLSLLRHGSMWMSAFIIIHILFYPFRFPEEHSTSSGYIPSILKVLQWKARLKSILHCIIN